MKFIITAICLILCVAPAYAIDADRDAKLQYLLGQKYSPQQINEIMDAYDEYKIRHSQEYSPARILLENQIVKDAAKSGDLALSLDAVQKAKDTNHYSDAWAMQLVARVKAAIAAAPHTIILGTAFFYNAAGDMFTNRHVIEKCNPQAINVRLSDGIMLRANVIAISKDYDLAALSTKQPTQSFGAIRTTEDGHTLVPDGAEDVFYAGYSAPVENQYKIQMKWGEIQPWEVKESPRFINRIRMDAYPGSSGSAILDYTGLVVAIVYAGSTDSVPDPQSLQKIGYGDKWIYALNDDAIVDFANSNKLHLSQWSKPERKDPTFVWQHASDISGLVSCTEIPKDKP